MRKPFRILLILAIVVGVAGICWHVFQSGRRLHQGRTENEWIASLTIPPGEKEMQQWRALGPEAIPILARALGHGTSPLGRWYQRNWYQLPMAMRNRLEKPWNLLAIRQNTLLVLAGLNCDITAAAPALGDALKDENQDLRVRAATLLKEKWPDLGLQKAGIVPELVQALQDTNQFVREKVTQCLGNCQEQSRMVAPALVRAFDDPVQFNRYLAVQSLKRMNLVEAGNGGVEPLLVRSLQNGDLNVCLNAATMLGDMKWDPAREISAFTEMLGDYRAVRQRLAAVALGKYGPQASSAVPALQHAFETGEPRVREAASNALVEIDPQTAAKEFASPGKLGSAAKP
jgi:HEAT repeat protein